MNIYFNYLSMLSGCSIGNKYYFIDTATRFLIEYDLMNHNYRVISYKMLQGQKGWIHTAGTFYYDNSLYFLFYYSRRIGKYDLLAGTYSEFGEYQYDNTGFQCSGGFLVNGKIIAFSANISEPVVVFDIVNCCLEEISFDVISDTIIESGKELMISSANVVDDSVYCCFYGTSLIGKISLRNSSIQITNFGKEKPIHCLLATEFECYFVDLEDGWLKVRNDNGEIKDLLKLAWSETSLIDRFSHAFKYEDYLFLLPNSDDGTGIVRVELKTKKVDTLQLPTKLKRTYRIQRPLFGACTAYTNKIILFPNSIDKVISLDLNSLKISEYDCELTKHDITISKTLDLIKRKEIMKEESRESLVAFFMCL